MEQTFTQFLVEVIWPLLVLAYVAGYATCWVLSGVSSRRQDGTATTPDDHTWHITPVQPWSAPESTKQKIARYPSTGGCGGSPIPVIRGGVIMGAGGSGSNFPPPFHIRVVQCVDPSMWYAQHIGKEFRVHRINFDTSRGTYIYWTHEPEGYVNFIYEYDLEVLKWSK